MMDDTYLLQVIFEAYVKYKLPFVVTKLKEELAALSTLPNTVSVEKTIHENMANHVIYATQWCEQLDFLNIGGEKLETQHSIPLNMTSNVKWLSPGLNEGKIYSESDILMSIDSFIILGDPGSGKSTSLKRILRQYFFSNDIQAIYSFPLLLRFRDEPFRKHDSIFTYIAKILGITYETTVTSIPHITKASQTVEDGFDDLGRKKYKDSMIEQVTYTHYNLYSYGKKALDEVVCSLLNENAFLIVLDGFDEIESSRTEKLIGEIQFLKMNTFACKIFLSSRPKYITKNIDGFSICQVCELNAKEIASIVSFYIKDNPDIFINELSKRSYAELANRPLFLSFLIQLYKDGIRKSIPQKAKEVYNEIIALYLERWDSDRNIERYSFYADFSVKRKIEFLEHLSFRLTYQIKSRSFTRRQFLIEYSNIHKRFDLPEDQADLVATEIENHNGIIVSAFGNQFEFSHLALQEYLCSQYLVTSQLSTKITEYLAEYPEPVSMAVAQSFESEILFANVVLNYLSQLKNITHFDSGKQSSQASKFLHRILIEQPYFDVDMNFGVSILYLATNADFDSEDFRQELASLINYHVNVKQSIKLALDNFAVDDKKDWKENTLIICTNHLYKKYFKHQALHKDIAEIILG